jgi:integrase
MASVSHDANGTKRILFTDGDGERRTVRLGKVSAKAAESFRLRVESLLSDKLTGKSWDAELSVWVRELPVKTHDRLARVGLVPPRDHITPVTVGELLTRFDAAAVVKPSTRAAYKQTTDSLRRHLGADMPLADVTAAHADRWRKAIAERGKRENRTHAGADDEDRALAPATVAKRVHIAKSIFKRAVRWGLMPSSPFAELRAGSQSNPDRSYYVTREAIGAILDACSDHEWRAIVSLSRFGGLRCPSELVALRWSDVNWQRGRLTVRSPKTARHEGHAVRVVPIAPELREVLQSLFDPAITGSESVIPRLRDPRMNLRTTFRKIIAKAGVQPWPRLFQNMRASCATDWSERFPAHVVAGWLGHSPLIAARHYLQTRDTHFDMAAGVEEPSNGGAKNGARRTHNAAQQRAARDRADSHGRMEVPAPADIAQTKTAPCETEPFTRMGATGLEPVTFAM